VDEKAAAAPLSDRAYVARLAESARLHPDQVGNLIRDNNDGTYTVTLHLNDPQSGQRLPQEIIVDTGFQNDAGDVAFAKPGETEDNWPELWAMLIEKAWAQVSGSDAGLTAQSKKDEDVFGLIMGVDPTAQRLAGANKDEVLDQLIKAVLNGQEVLVSAKDPTDDMAKDQMQQEGIVGSNAYVLVRVDVNAGTVSLQNPRASKVLDDLPVEKLLHYFDHYTIAAQS
jgi:hypothetical protein